MSALYYEVWAKIIKTNKQTNGKKRSDNAKGLLLAEQVPLRSICHLGTLLLELRLLRVLARACSAHGERKPWEEPADLPLAAPREQENKAPHLFVVPLPNCDVQTVMLGDARPRQKPCCHGFSVP